MMMKVVLKFNDKERTQLNEFASQVGMSIDKVCRNAVFYTINDAYRRAAEMEKAKEAVRAQHDPTTRDSESDSQSEHVSGPAGSPTLSDQTDSTSSSQEI